MRSKEEEQGGRKKMKKNKEKRGKVKGDEMQKISKENDGEKLGEKIRERGGGERVRDEKEQMKVQEGSDTKYYDLRVLCQEVVR